MATRLVIRGGTVVNPQQSTHEADILIEDGRIIDIGGTYADDSESIDATDCLVLPGLVNGHAHGCTTGPLFSSGAMPLGEEQALSNAERHLRAGVTTLVNVCGFGLPSDRIDHQLDIHLGTTHLPAAVEAADLVDASGMQERHRQMTAQRMIENGAVALGEIGSGATLGGGVAAYRYVPDALEGPLGRRLAPEEATVLIDALVGPSRLDEPDDGALALALQALGVSADLAPEVRAAILRYASAPVLASLRSFTEATELSEQLNVPAVFHVARPSAKTLLHLARHTNARIVAGHVNHTSFTPDEAVEVARQLRAEGATIDVSSLDIVQARRLATPDVADALAREGLVDTLSTDYAGGAWEPMLGVVQRWIDAGYVTLEEGIAMCTETPAKVFGFEDRGRIARGLRADLAIVAGDNVSDVRWVVAEGQVVDCG